MKPYIKELGKVIVCVVAVERKLKPPSTCFSSAKMIWKIAPVRWEGLTELQINIWRLWDAVMQSANKEQGLDRIKLTANILWQIWKARNRMVFHLESTDTKQVVDKAQLEWIEYENETDANAGKQVTPEMDRQQQHCWEPPKEGVIEINTDAAISARMVRTSQGIIARNWLGKIIKAKGISECKQGDASREESLAIRSALVMAKDACWTNIEVQTDSKGVVDQINTGNVQDSNIETVLEDIDDLRQEFDCCKFSFVPRKGNGCSHALAQFATKLVKNVEWENTFPMWLIDLVRKDMGVVTPFCN
ncbi:uncharacterized protein LOC113782367 [Coffea eugenioides]|nr:uncharacterized protein LOC113782367 [Coffea eugenioides]